MNLGLSFGHKSGQIGGGRPVFDQRYRQARVADGALIDNPPAYGGIIYAGDIAQFDASTHTCKHLKVFEVAADVTDASTSVLVKKTAFGHVLEAGLVIMAAPATLATTGTAITVGAVTIVEDETAGTCYSFDIVAESFGTLTAGDYLIEAAAAGSGKLPLITNPNACFTHDIYIDEVPTSDADWKNGFKFSASLYNDATILSVFATPVPDCILANLRTGYSDIRVINYN